MKVLSQQFLVLTITALTLLLTGSGCIVDSQEQQMRMQQQREDALIVQEDLRRIQSRIESLEQDMIRMTQQLNESSSMQANSYQSQFKAMNSSLDELQQQIRAVDARRESDKQEVVNALSAKITTMMKTQPSRSSGSSRPISGEGYEHVVESGETLSAIAKAYKVSPNDIVRANNLKSADLLRVGQTLFIPAP